MQPKILNQRYEIEEKIGDGGMAAVYRGRDIRLNRVVAIKVLHAHHATDSNFLQRFNHEAQVAANLRHPSIVDIYDVGREDRFHYIVMEFVDGSDLKSLILRYKQLPVQQVLQIGSAIAEGLDAAHQLGMVHRDVKPQNIMVTHDSTAKITDFGIAKSGLSTAQTETGVTFGTADYISPEQARGQSATAQSDIYALGVTIYESLTGQLPFTGDNAVAVAIQHVSSKPPPIRRHNPNVSPALEQLIMRALAKNPADRPSTAKEFARLLRAQEESEVRDTAPLQPRRKPANNGRTSTSISGSIRNMPPKRSTITSPLPSRAGREFGGFLLLMLLLTLAMAVIYLLFMGPLNTLIQQGPSSVVPLNTEAVQSTAAIDTTAPVAPTAVVRNVPDVRGQTEANALVLATQAGFNAVAAPAQSSDTVARGLVIEQRPAPGASDNTDNMLVYVISLGSAGVTIPDTVIGQTVENAKSTLESLGLQVTFVNESSASVEAGSVMRTDPAVGSKITKTDIVRVYVSIGPNASVPVLVGISEAEAIDLITRAGLTYGATDYQDCTKLGDLCDRIQAGTVASSDPAEGTLVPIGTTINIGVRQDP
jgi:serine/threonine protein kinase/beta-lactam-binding protein with PASTA domain